MRYRVWIALGIVEFYCLAAIVSYYIGGIDYALPFAISVPPFICILIALCIAEVSRSKTGK